MTYQCNTCNSYWSSPFGRVEKQAKGADLFRLQTGLPVWKNRKEEQKCKQTRKEKEEKGKKKGSERTMRNENEKGQTKHKRWENEKKEENEEKKENTKRKKKKKGEGKRETVQQKNELHSYSLRLIANVHIVIQK